MSRWSTFALTTVSVLALAAGTVTDADTHQGSDDRPSAVAPQPKMAKDHNWCC